MECLWITTALESDINNSGLGLSRTDKVLTAHVCFHKPAQSQSRRCLTFLNITYFVIFPYFIQSLHWNIVIQVNIPYLSSSLQLYVGFLSCLIGFGGVFCWFLLVFFFWKGEGGGASNNVNQQNNATKYGKKNNIICHVIWLLSTLHCFTSKSRGAFIIQWIIFPPIS